MDDRQRLLAKFGYAAPAVAVSFVFLGTLLDPKFSWESRSLSSIGEATGTSLFALGSLDQVAFNLFNGGLLLSPVLGLPFAVALWNDAKMGAERAGIVLLLLTLFGNFFVGVAYLDGPFASIHFPAAMTFFFGIGLTIWTYSTGMIQRTDAERGLGFMWVANFYGLAWIIWILLETMAFTSDDVWTWFAVPEFIGAVVFGLWIAAQAHRILNAESAETDATTDSTDSTG
jgi:hypothetical membrane protein